MDDTTKLVEEAADTKSQNMQNVWVVKLGFAIICFSFLVVIGVIGGSFVLMVRGEALRGLDAGTGAMLGGLIGTALGWVLSNGNMATSFFFGTTPSARSNATKLSDAAAGAVSAAARVLPKI